jgi:membrane associated rhomboid family serine protease
MFPLKDNIPLGRLPLVTITLLVLDLAAYLAAIRHGGSFWGGPSDAVLVHYGAIPFELTHPGEHCEPVRMLAGGLAPVRCQTHGSAAQPATWFTLFSSLVLHAGFLHVFGDMLFLAIFGPTVEDRVGRGRYLLLFVLGGLIALAAQTAFDPGSTAPVLGASGAVAAVIGGYILLFPRARVLTLVLIIFFVTIIEVPVLVMVGLWFGEQLWFAAAGLASPLGGAWVACLADVGAFAFGLLAIRLFASRPAGEQPRAALS